jgi:hypothetical protein
MAHYTFLLLEVLSRVEVMNVVISRHLFRISVG